MMVEIKLCFIFAQRNQVNISTKIISDVKYPTKFQQLYTIPGAKILILWQSLDRSVAEELRLTRRNRTVF